MGKLLVEQRFSEKKKLTDNLRLVFVGQNCVRQIRANNIKDDPMIRTLFPPRSKRVNQSPDDSTNWEGGPF